MLILTAGLTLVVRSFGSSFDALRASRDYTKAMLLLDQRMGELEAQGSVVPGTATGRFSEEGEAFEWEVRVAEPTVIDPKVTGFCETLVTVSWQQHGRPRAISLVTYLTPEKRRER